VRLSIITINLNNSAGLRKTIESIICQKHNDFEFIVIDGGSIDGSLDIIKNYENKIDYWASEKDQGIYNAMNKGIQKSHGEYCFFLNSGDYFVKDDVLKKIFENEIQQDVVFGNMIVLFNNKVVGKSKGKSKITFLDIYCGIVKHQAAFIKRSLFDDFGLYNEKLKIISDWEFFLKTIGIGDSTYKYLDIDITCFDNNGISNNSEAIVASERKTVIDMCLPSMMRDDYAFFEQFGRYEAVTRYKFPYFILKLMAKGIKLYKSQ
jgi:glycosyltransferase involved in cell wall biosynthesis